MRVRIGYFRCLEMKFMEIEIRRTTYYAKTIKSHARVVLVETRELHVPFGNPGWSYGSESGTFVAWQ
jgi:hypothetical protein